MREAVPDYTRPLQFPGGERFYVPRRLRKYGWEDKPVRIDHLLEAISRRESLAILSAEGTGKTSLINEIAYRAEQLDEGIIPIGRIELYLCRGVDDLEDVLRVVQEQVVQYAKSRLPESSLPPLEEDLEASFSANLRRIFDRLKRRERGRIILLLLDDLHVLSPRVVVRFASHLRSLHQDRDDLCLVLTAARSLDDVVRHDWSPLKNILESYTLLDFQYEDLGAFVREGEFAITPEMMERIYEWTRGYPYLVVLLFHKLLSEAPRSITPEMVDRAVEKSLEGVIAPFETARKAILQAATGPGADRTPWQLVQQLLEGEAPKFDDSPGAPFLAIHGVVAKGPKGEVVWRNRMIQRYMERVAPDLAARIPAPSLRAETALRGSGWIYVNLVMDFRRFVQEAHKLRFDQLRGSEEYADALNKLAQVVEERQQAETDDGEKEGQQVETDGGEKEGQQAETDGGKKFPFRIDQEEKELLNVGTDLGIFHSSLVEQAFFPLYWLQDPKENVCIPSYLKKKWAENASPSKEEEDYLQAWSRWDRIGLRLTPEGLVHIHLRKEINAQKLPDLLGESVLELEKELEDKQRSVQWEIALGLVEHFIERSFDVAEEGPAPRRPIQDQGKEASLYRMPSLKDVLFDKRGTPRKGAPIYPLRDRYVVYFFDKLCACSGWASRVLVARDLKENLKYACEIASLLEGVMLKQGKEYIVPELKREEMETLFEGDLSSWEGELCLLTGDNALVYFRALEPVERSETSQVERVCGGCNRPEVRKIQKIRFAGRSVSYEDYWKCILRGIEYILDLRLLARLLTEETKRYTVTIAEQAADGDRRMSMRMLRKRVTVMTRLLSRLRDASVPRSIAPADYAVRKFEHLMEISGLRESISHAASNIDAANALLEHQEEMLMTVLFATIAVLLSCLTIPSMLIDWWSFTNNVSDVISVFPLGPARLTGYALCLIPAAVLIAFAAWIGFSAWRASWKEERLRFREWKERKRKTYSSEEADNDADNAADTADRGS